MDEKLYVIPSEKTLELIQELNRSKICAAFALKQYVQYIDVDKWDDSPIPEFTELYCGANSIIDLIQTLKEHSPDQTPEEYLSALEENDIVINNTEYVSLMALITSMRTLQESLAAKHKNISFEVH